MIFILCSRVKTANKTRQISFSMSSLKVMKAKKVTSGRALSEKWLRLQSDMWTRWEQSCSNSLQVCNHNWMTCVRAKWLKTRDWKNILIILAKSIRVRLKNRWEKSSKKIYLMKSSPESIDVLRNWKQIKLMIYSLKSLESLKTIFKGNQMKSKREMIKTGTFWVNLQEKRWTLLNLKISYQMITTSPNHIASKNRMLMLNNNFHLTEKIKQLSSDWLISWLDTFKDIF